MGVRLDQELVQRGLVSTRSQAESYVKLGYVRVNGAVITKSAKPVSEKDTVTITITEQYVSRAALKLDSVVNMLHISFQNKTILDVGSSTGGFTDYAIRHHASYIIAVEVGSNQLHQSLRNNPNIEVHENTDIRSMQTFSRPIDIVLIDVSFISLREILPHVLSFIQPSTVVIAMAKPQFEANSQHIKHKGVIKNERLRRDILKSFELWVLQYFKVLQKADSHIPGAKGNLERFYLLKKI